MKKKAKVVVRSGIRTHAHRSGLRPERSALDLSAILTHTILGRTVKSSVEQDFPRVETGPILCPITEGRLAQLVRASC